MEKQPLLLVNDRGEPQPYTVVRDYDAEMQGGRVMATKARRSGGRRAVRLVHALLLPALVVTLLLWWTGVVPVPSAVAALFNRAGLHATPGPWLGGGHGGSDGETPDTRVPAGAVPVDGPVDGPVVLPAALQCFGSGDDDALVTYPTASYPVVFGTDRVLVVRQNATRAGHDDEDDVPQMHRVHVAGDVVLRRAAAGHAGSVDVEAVSNDKRIGVRHAWNATAQVLAITVDDRLWVDETDDDDDAAPRQACLTVRATVWVPAGAEAEAAAAAAAAAAHLAALRVDNVHLGVQLLDDLALEVDGAARLASVVGSISGARAAADADASALSTASASVSAYRFAAPRLVLASVAGPVRGLWTLQDRLRISSVAGDVDVAVAPEGSADAADPAARRRGLASLSIETVSGSVRFSEVTAADAADAADAAAVRGHVLYIGSRSGDVSGAASFARAATVHTTSGDVDVTLRPVVSAVDAKANKAGKSGRTTSLTTTTVSGSADVRVLDAAGLPAGRVLDFLRSTHKAVSGSLRLAYPAAWVGDVHLQTVAGGAVAVDGDGVHVLPDDRPRWPPRMGHRLDAIKTAPGSGDDLVEGTPRSRLMAESVSGSVHLAFP